MFVMGDKVIPGEIDSYVVDTTATALAHFEVEVPKVRGLTLDGRPIALDRSLPPSRTPTCKATITYCMYPEWFTRGVYIAIGLALIICICIFFRCRKNGDYNYKV
jgi:hypothetical protein